MATEIQIDSIYPTSGAMPSMGTDGTSGLSYTAWELNDEGRFNFFIPSDFTTNVALEVRMVESSPNTEDNHQWQVTVLLVQPGTNVTDEATEQDTVTQEYTSSATADTSTARTFNLTTSNQISGTDVAGGDLIACTLKRIAASEDEDTAAIKLFNLSIIITGLGETGAYAGSRLETIELNFRDLCNDDDSDFVSRTQFLRAVNGCQRWMARNGVWIKESSFDSSTSETYTLTSVITDIVELYNIRWYDADINMVRCHSWDQYREFVENVTSSGAPSYYYVESGTLYIWPAYTSVVSDAFYALHSYLPPDLDEATYFTPTIPEAHDDIYVYYARWRDAERDATAPEAPQKVAMFRALAEEELRRLLKKRGARFVPYR